MASVAARRNKEITTIVLLCRELYGGKGERLKELETRMVECIRRDRSGVAGTYALYRLVDGLLPEEPEEFGVKDASGSVYGARALRLLEELGGAVPVGKGRSKLDEHFFERIRKMAEETLDQETLENLDRTIEEVIEG